MGIEGYCSSAVRATIDHLEKSRQIHKMGLDCIASVACLVTSIKEDEGLYDVEIEKVLPGSALCIVNNKWRAQLVPKEYEGPPNLIKKNTKFRVRGVLHQEGENLYLQVQRVQRILGTH
jgi:hypothetical protein